MAEHEKPAPAPRQETPAETTVAAQKSTAKEKIKTYIKAMPKRYFITAFSGMAQGLFVTLIAGTILAMIAGWFPGNYFGRTLTGISNIAKSMMGAGIGVGIAHALKKPKLLIFSAAVAGMVGAFAEKFFPSAAAPFSDIALGTPGNPIGAYVATMLVIEIVSLYAGKTKLDIILIPLGALFLSFAGIFAAYPFIKLIGWLGDFIAFATDATPFVMGVVIAVVMGVVLTMPTSSAAIWISVASPILSGYASGAAGVTEAQYNIMKKPVIMLPMILSSAILGPLSTCVFKVKCGASGGGMGTSGLVGVFDSFKYTSGALGCIGIVLLTIVLPAALNLLFSEWFRKKGWIKQNDMLLPE